MSRLEPVTAAQLREIPLLRDVPAEARELLRPLLSLAHFDKGERIAHAGAYLDGAYYLLAGSVDVHMPAAAGQPGVAGGTIVIEDLPISVRAGARTSIDAGSIFGEGSALSRYPIAADFDAATDVTCLLIRTAALRAMFDLPELARVQGRIRSRLQGAHPARTLAALRAVRECRRRDPRDADQPCRTGCVQAGQGDCR